MESDFKSSAPDGFFLTNDVPFEGVEKKTFQTEYELLDLIGKGYFRQLDYLRYVFIRDVFGGEKVSSSQNRQVVRRQNIKKKR